ncbi:MAG: hypothetical protein P8Y70_12975 [Candidatus Lokiarchaeota archaeon]
MRKKTKISIIIASIAVISIASVLSFFFLPPLFDSIGPVPKFVDHDWIDLDYIGNISKYGSTIGHPYPDEASNVSYKHYFNPIPGDGDDNHTIQTFAPAEVRVVKIEEEQLRGQQIFLKSIEHPSISFVLFHQNLDPNITINTILEPGDPIGYCDCRNNSYVSIAVFRGSDTISWFEVLTDRFMGNYTVRGIPSISYMIKTPTEIAQSAAAGYDFSNPDPNDWVTLTSP